MQNFSQMISTLPFGFCATPNNKACTINVGLAALKTNRQRDGNKGHLHGQIGEFQNVLSGYPRVWTIRKPYGVVSAYGSPFNLGPWPWQHHDILM